VWRADVERFVEFVRGSGPRAEEAQEQALDFHRVVPYPEPFIQLDREAADAQALLEKLSPEERRAWVAEHGYPKDGFNQGGYEWRRSEWGTKWNASEVETEWVSDGEILYRFQTAWSPPRPIVEALAARFPMLELRLEFWERGAGFQGVLRYKGRECLEDSMADYAGPRGG
jgi:hypothetical protein